MGLWANFSLRGRAHYPIPITRCSADGEQRHKIAQDLLDFPRVVAGRCVYRKLKPERRDGEARRGSGVNE